MIQNASKCFIFRENQRTWRQCSTMPGWLKAGEVQVACYSKRVNWFHVLSTWMKIHDHSERSSPFDHWDWPGHLVLSDHEERHWDIPEQALDVLWVQDWDILGEVSDMFVNCTIQANDSESWSSSSKTLTQGCNDCNGYLIIYGSLTCLVQSTGGLDPSGQPGRA